MYDEEKVSHHHVICSYLEKDIISEKIALPLSIMFTLFFIVQKLHDNFMAKWQATFLPIYIYLIYSFLKHFIRIIKSELREEDGEGYSHNYTKSSNDIAKIVNINNILLLSNFFSLINSALSIFSVYYLGDFLDRRKDESLISSIYMIITLNGSWMSYSLIRKMEIFRLKRKEQDHEEESHVDSRMAFFSSLTAPILTYLSNMMIVCNSGVCTQIYMSTIASLLGALGVTISDLSDYLFPITVVLLGVSLFSLYIKKKKFTHPPFLLGVASTISIILAHLFENTMLNYLLYPGNIGMIAAAIWNARVNKFYGLPRFKK
jgi:hypothetical protein